MSERITRIVAQLEYGQQKGVLPPDEIVHRLHQNLREFCAREDGLELLIIGYADEPQEPQRPQLRLIEFPSSSGEDERS